LPTPVGLLDSVGSRTLLESSISLNCGSYEHGILIISLELLLSLMVVAAVVVAVVLAGAAAVAVVVAVCRTLHC